MHHILQLVASVVLALCWILWIVAFLRPRKRGPRTVKVVSATISWLGIFLTLLGFVCIGAYIHPAHYEHPLPLLVFGMLIAPPSTLLAWRASRELGKHWRFAAVLNDDHCLVQTGPYFKMRHPIYASTVGMILATGAVYTWWPLFILGSIFILLGIEIRVRSEERLMEQFFQDEYIEYRSRTRSYLPF